MAWQLIYTSAPRTLTAGQSGYGTVARHAEMREALVQRLEQLSYYSQGQSTTDGSGLNPIIFAYRVLDVRGSKYHVLSRIQDAGLDFTKRTNHLAHHLVFEPQELDTLPSPTLIFLRWDRWCGEWREEPRWLSENDWGNLPRLPRYAPGVASQWQEIAGDAGAAASLLESPHASGCYLACDPGTEKRLASLWGETLRLLDPEGRFPSRCWQHTFTTCLQSEDQPLDFHWRGLCAGTPAWQAAQRGNVTLLHPRLLTAPQNQLAQLARQGSSPRVAIPADLSSARQASQTRNAPAPAAPPRMGLTSGTPASTASVWDQISLEKNRRSTSPFGANPAQAQGTRRWLAAALIVLLMLLLTTLVWPGWLRSRKTTGAPQPAPTETNAAVTLEAPHTPASPPGLVLPAPVIPNSEVSPASAPSATLTDNQLNQLERQIDSLTTYVVMAVESNAVRLPRIPELDQLLVRLVKGNPPLAKDSIECLLQTNTLLLTTRGSFPASVDLNQTRNELVFSGETKLNLNLAFDRWLQDTNQPIQLTHIEPQPLHSSALQSLTLMLQPRGGAKDFLPFRLVVVARNSVPTPMVFTNQSNTSFLMSDAPSLDRSMSAPLWERLQALRLRPLRLEVHAFLATNAVWDAHRALGFKFPTNGVGLNFTELRKSIGEKIALAQAEVDQVQQELRSQTDERILGLQLGGPYTLGGYAKAKQSGLSRELYLDFLKQSLPHLSRELANAKTRRSALRELSKSVILPGATEVVAASRPDYFLELLNQLPTQERLIALYQQEREARSGVAQWQNKLGLAPSELSQVPRTGLFLAEPSGQRVEFIRFQ
jgi:hypothetical protein